MLTFLGNMKKAPQIQKFKVLQYFYHLLLRPRPLQDTPPS